MSREQKLVVWDVDETLCHTHFDERDVAAKAKESPSFKQHRFFYFTLPSDSSAVWGSFRHGAAEAIVMLDKYGVRQMIWSAGEREYVNMLARELEALTGVKFAMIYTRDDCDNIYDRKTGVVTTTKNLQALWDRDISSPKSTIMIDNRSDVCVFNPNNHILVPDFDPPATDLFKKDDVLPTVARHIIDNRNVDDVRWITSTDILIS